jgi:ribosome biogenesis GTPase
MHHIDAMQLAAYMPDFKPHVAHCKFYNCSHLHEPGCGVQAAVTAGAITASRFKLYGLLFAELTQPTHY